MDQQAQIAIGIFLVIYALIISEKIHRTIVKKPPFTTSISIRLACSLA